MVGFGGMYNPKIWTGSNVLSTEDMNTLYGPGGLGYSVLRLMITQRSRLEHRRRSRQARTGERRHRLRLSLGRTRCADRTGEGGRQ